MANEIYHRSNWGNAVNDIAWGDVYEKFDATNEMFVRSDNYENSNETDKLMAAINPKPSILLTPTAYDNGSLHSVKPVLTPFADFDFTRGTIATRVNEQGLIEDVTDTNLPRIDYTDGSGSLLLEPQSTNLLTYSQDFSQSVWRKRTSDSTQVPVITNNYAISPDGTQNATRVVITPPTLNTDYAVVDNFTSITKNVGDKFTSSIYIKANGVSQIGKEVNLYQYEDGYSTVLTHSLTDNWIRLELTDTMGLSTGNMETLTIGKARSSVGGSSLSDMATDFLIAFAQFEKQSFATSYIPTSGSTVTRNQDVCNNSGSSDLINSTEGVLYAEIAALADDQTRRDISISDGTNTNTIRFHYHTVLNEIRFQVRSSGAARTSQAFSVTDIKDFHKVALSYKLDNVRMFIDGVKVGTDTIADPMPTGLNELSFYQGAASLNFFGNVKSVAVYKEALTDAQLTALTT